MRREPNSLPIREAGPPAAPPGSNADPSRGTAGTPNNSVLRAWCKRQARRRSSPAQGRGHRLAPVRASGWSLPFGQVAAAAPSGHRLAPVRGSGCTGRRPAVHPVPRPSRRLDTPAWPRTLGPTYPAGRQLCVGARGVARQGRVRLQSPCICRKRALVRSMSCTRSNSFNHSWVTAAIKPSSGGAGPPGY